MRGPIHYDILIPLTPDVRDQFAFLTDQGVPVYAPQAQWLVAGWGAEAFYTQTGDYTDLSVKAVWRGITGDKSVLRLDVMGALSEQTAQIWLDTSAAQLDALTGNIIQQVQARPTLGVDGFTYTDVFYQTAGGFHLFRTCNVWVGEQLRTAGFKFGMWTPTPYAVTLSAWLYGGQG